MAQQIPILTLSRVAAGPIPVCRFVGLDDNVCQAGAAAWGVSDFEALVAGKQIPVKTLGTGKVQVGAPLAQGQLVKSDAQGQAVPQAGAGAILGRVIVGQVNVGGYAEILLLPTLSAA